ncbi:hypothetical protein ISF_07550 [Cordyceps fumosorosea ARSEF 2679]|uniref:Uncharacterized protein n=1 Tax=Cordyceps fumosorosea (strain ARSEF 2679) TaxID=1081104 RepID=A0A167PB82_CORFA|nr:hypothetical protein ISF_07550 [Cordyceps fumosorosea ARSEF 2679]OAA56482.1 hypothetical protein ISF_07550 [Cordyceps fumosorosea ARSEF 2679]
MLDGAQYNFAVQPEQPPFSLSLLTPHSAAQRCLTGYTTTRSRPLPPSAVPPLRPSRGSSTCATPPRPAPPPAEPARRARPAPPPRAVPPRRPLLQLLPARWWRTGNPGGERADQGGGGRRAMPESQGAEPARAGGAGGAGGGRGEEAPGPSSRGKADAGEEGGGGGGGGDVDGERGARGGALDGEEEMGGEDEEAAGRGPAGVRERQRLRGVQAGGGGRVAAVSDGLEDGPGGAPRDGGRDGPRAKGGHAGAAGSAAHGGGVDRHVLRAEEEEAHPRLGSGRERRAEAGGGGGGGQRRGGCWLARDEEARLMMEVDVEALLLSSGEDEDEEDEDEEDEYEVEYAQGRWRLLKRATSRKEEEGYSQHLPAGAFAAVMRVTPERSSRSSSTRRRRSKERQSGEAKVSPPSPPPPAKSDDDRQPSRTNERVPERSPPTSSLRASASTVVVEPPPRTTAAPDGIPAAAARTWPTQPSLPSPPLSLASEAELAAIYDAYYRAAAAADDVGTTAPSIRAGIRGPPSPPCTRSAPPQPVSPLPEHGYVAAEREVERRDHGDDESLHPRPLRTRHYRPRSSGIPVPKHPTAVGMPRVGSVHSVSSTVLLGCGGGGGRRWPRPVEGC